MKHSILALIFAACAVSGLAHAADTSASNDDTSNTAQTWQWSPTRNSIAPKTRAQVRQELVQAERNGLLAGLNTSLYRGGM